MRKRSLVSDTVLPQWRNVFGGDRSASRSTRFVGDGKKQCNTRKTRKCCLGRNHWKGYARTRSGTHSINVWRQQWPLSLWSVIKVWSIMRGHTCFVPPLYTLHRREHSCRNSVNTLLEETNPTCWNTRGHPCTLRFAASLLSPVHHRLWWLSASVLCVLLNLESIKLHHLKL